jgi:undecaprenyl-diphosphatase
VIGQIRRFIEWLGSHGWLVLTANLIVVAGIWGFIELLDEVREGDTERFDAWAVRLMSQWHGPEHRVLEEIGRDLTALGGITLLTICTAAVVGFLCMIRKFHAMWLVIIATAGGLVLSSALKAVINRPRPDLVEHHSHVITSSFPSGHSMMAAVVYLTLGSLLSRFVERRRLKFYFLAVALIVTFLVGISRVYMGVHWPTDVLAGWTAGLVWAILCWLVARRLQGSGAVESDHQVESGE